MIPGNEPAMKTYEVVLNDLPCEINTIETTDKNPNNCKNPKTLIPAAYNQKQTNRWGLAKSSKIKIGGKVTLIVNLDIPGCLITGQTGNIRHIEFAQVSFLKVQLKFSYMQSDLITMKSCYLGSQNIWFTIKKCETEISINKRLASPSIKHIQFPLILAWTSTVYEVQSWRLE